MRKAASVAVMLGPVAASAALVAPTLVEADSKLVTFSEADDP